MRRHLSGSILLWALMTLGSAAAQPATSPISPSKAGANPENITMAPGGALILGSGSPIIYRAKPGSTIAEPFIDTSADGDARFLGVLADAPTNTLWACQMFPVPNTNRRASALRGFNLTTGQPKFRWDLPGDNVTCNDITVAANHTVYFTDTPNGRIYRLAPGAQTPELWLEDRALLGVDGITMLNGTIYVNFFPVSAIWHSKPSRVRYWDSIPVSSTSSSISKTLCMILFGAYSGRTFGGMQHQLSTHTERRPRRLCRGAAMKSFRLLIAPCHEWGFPNVRIA